MRIFGLYCILLFSVLRFIQAGERTVDLVFQFQPGNQNVVTVDLNPGSSDSQNTSYSGTINAQVTFDEETLEPKQFRFTGGRVYTTDVDVRFSGNIFYYDAGRSIHTTFGFRFLDLSAIYTTVGTGNVNSNGYLVLSDHRTKVDQGRGIVDATVQGFGSVSETEHFSSASEWEPLSGSGRIIISELSSNELEKELLFTLISETDSTETDPFEDTNASLTITEVGTNTLTATTTIPTRIAQWLTDNNIEPNQLDARSPSGIPYRILHAFDLDKASGALPISPSSDQSGKPMVTIELPSSGLNSGLKAQYRASLSEGEWEDLPATNHMNGMDSLDSGESGTVQLSFPEANQGYIRLAPAD